MKLGPEATSTFNKLIREKAPMMNNLESYKHLPLIEIKDENEGDINDSKYNSQYGTLPAAPSDSVLNSEKPKIQREGNGSKK
jgi:hypothetical protein